METRVNYTLVGVFVVLLASALAAIVIWLGKGDYRGAYERYFAYMRESVAGLSVNAAVKYRGVDVGRVKEIMLNPDNPEEVRLTLDITRGTPVKEDTIAVLETQGLTGLATVNLTGGSRDSPFLTAKASEIYPVIQAGPSLFFRLDMALSRLLMEQPVPRLLGNLIELTHDARSIMDEGNRAALKQVLGDLATTSRALAARSEQLDHGVASAAQAMETLAKTSKTMNERLPQILERVERTAGALERMSKDLARASTTASGLVENARPGIQQFTGQTLGETALLVGELRQLTATLQRVASQVEREPNTLIFGRSSHTKGPGE